MSDKRRAEIEAKRQKLAELRKAHLDELVNSLVGTPSRGSRESTGERSPSIPGTPSLGNTIGLPGPSILSISGSGRASRQSDFSASVGPQQAQPSSSTDHVIERSVLTPRIYGDLIDVEQELFDLPRKERVSYNKEVQTTAIETEDRPDNYEDELRQRILREHDVEKERLAHEKELEEEKLTEEERAGILAAPEFLDFVEKSSKIVQRALNDGYDYIRDYTIGAESGGDDSEGRVKRVCEFYDERYGKNRSITDVDWSPKYPELSVASYNKNPAALNEPDGIVAVWNLHLLERPDIELTRITQSDVLSVTFSPFHSNLIFGGTYSGQILLWDTRSKHLPVLKTPLSAAGHTHPVYAMQMVGTQNAHNLITSSTDGTVCSWLVDMLAQPQETLELVHAGHNKTGEVAITTLDFPDNETTTFWVGTEEGTVYQANRYDRAGAKAGLNQYDVYKGHAGPVMNLHFHPLVGPVDFSDLFLTSSVDWTVKLWRATSLQKPSTTPQVISPLYSFDEADDHVYDVKWHPAHPAVFGTVDGSGHFDLWNLNTDTEVPVVSTTVGSGRAINKLEWDRKDGRRAALGGSDGRLYIYDIGDMALPRESEWTDMQKNISGIVGGGQAVNGADLSGHDHQIKKTLDQRQNEQFFSFKLTYVCHTPSFSSMQQALLIDEIIRHIFHFSAEDGLATLNSIARSCKAWECPALDRIWARLSSIAPLLQVIPGVESVDGMFVSSMPLHTELGRTPNFNMQVLKGTCPDPDLTRFRFYAARVRHITHQVKVQVHPSILSIVLAETSSTALPYLRSAKLSTANCDEAQTSLSLSGTLNKLDLDVGFKRKASNEHLVQYFQDAVKAAPGLQHLSIRGTLAKPFISLVASMNGLHTLSLRSGTSISVDALLAVSRFPNLSDLEIHLGHIDPDILSTALTENNTTLFPSLLQLRMRALTPVLALILATIPLDIMHTLYIEADEAADVPAAWNSVFANIRAKNSNSLRNLTIEHHIEVDDMELESASGTDTTGPSPGPPPRNTPIAFSDLKVLGSLHQLSKFVLDTTLPPAINDEGLADLVSGWPQLRHLDLGLAHTPSSETLTFRSLPTLALKTPYLKSLVIGTVLDGCDLAAIPVDTPRQCSLTRLTFSCIPTPLDLPRLTPFLRRLFPALLEVDGFAEHDDGWCELRHALQ
ncbi:hypothetical protein H0H93_008799 [Arthromyces matolae]|nr:hypothetical protein H0H93_008799 [Arthromyces matolae]